MHGINRQQCNASGRAPAPYSSSVTRRAAEGPCWDQVGGIHCGPAMTVAIHTSGGLANGEFQPQPMKIK